MTLSLRARLTTVSTIVFGILFMAISAVSYVVLARTMNRDVTQRLSTLANGLHGYLRFTGGTATVDFDRADADQAAFVHEATRFYQVYDADDGRLLAESSGTEPLGLELTPTEVSAYVAVPTPFDITTEYGPLRVSNDVGTRADGRRYLLQIATPLAQMNAALKSYRDVLLWRFLPSLLVAILAFWWLSGIALRPMSRVAAAAREIDVSSLDRRLPIRGADDELDYIAASFNDTLARLQRAVADMRQFSTAMAHELRTPLASLRGGIELSLRGRDASEAQRDALASQIEDIDRLTNLIDRVLTLARAESGQIRLKSEAFDIGELATALVDQVVIIAESRSIELSCESTSAWVVGDQGWIQQMLLNLIDNALKYTGANGRVHLRVSRDGDLARVDVRDSGVGLSPDDARQVFDRFFRADRARSATTEGTGLGLSLVQWIAVQHHGTVTVESRLGEGSTFTVRLPLRPGGKST